jgi:hypothetical protein
MTTVSPSPESRSSSSGLVEMWREWMEPWDVYWTEVEDFIDAGDGRVVVLLRDHGRLQGSDADVALIAASSVDRSRPEDRSNRLLCQSG